MTRSRASGGGGLSRWSGTSCRRSPAGFAAAHDTPLGVRPGVPGIRLPGDIALEVGAAGVAKLRDRDGPTEAAPKRPQRPGADFLGLAYREDRPQEGFFDRRFRQPVRVPRVA